VLCSNPIKAHRTGVGVKGEETSTNKLFVRGAETIQNQNKTVPTWILFFGDVDSISN